MGCVAPGNQKHGSYRETMMMNILDNEEVRALKLIYNDLSQRHIYQKIDYENFLLFFRKNGLWGSTLFKEFDLDHSDLIAESEFIIGIAKIFKSTEEEKAKLLFSHFAKNKHEDDIEGVLYKDFVRMLYNYPKSDLREILHDQHFFETQIKEKLENVNNPYSTISRIPQKQTVVLKYIQQRGNSNNEEQVPENDPFRRSDGDQGESKANLNVSLTFFLYDKKLNVKMTSIHTLVRKYTEMIFQQQGISPKTGRIQEDSFIQWAKKHPKLYTNYYGGLHKEIWALNSKGEMGYLSQLPEKSAVGLLLEPKQKSKRKVGMLYMKNFLILHQPNKKNNLIKIIYLEGLDVTKIYEEGNGHGIQISHHNGIYREKKIFLPNQQATKQWMEALKYYQSQTIYQQFTVGKRIGAGKFSIVYECQQISTEASFALKQVETYKLSQDAKQILSKQAKILAILDHPSIPKFHKCFITKTHNYIVMELAKGVDLYEYVREREKLSEVEAIPIVKQLIKTIFYLQTLGIVHRDLKPDNIMLQNTKDKLIKPSVKILDFGFANYVEEIKNLPHECKAVGTPNFIAPQLIRGDQISQKMDNFSIGSIVYYMLSGCLPFAGESVEEVFEKTKHADFGFQSFKWKKVSAEAKDFISHLMTEKPADRMDLKSALKHKWMTETIIKEESPRLPQTATEKQKKKYEVY